MKSSFARCCLLALGIVVMALGIDFIVAADLGNSPISSFGYVLTKAFPGISFGVFMFVWNMLLLLGQVIILRKQFHPVALLQIPISVLFSLAIDAFGIPFSFVEPINYPHALLLLAIGTAILALGVAFTVVANVAMNSGEALVSAITTKTGWNFGHTKVGFDLGCVILAVASSLLLTGEIIGVREGTLAAAACTGFIVNIYVRGMGGPRPALHEANLKNVVQAFEQTSTIQAASQDTPCEFSDFAQNRVESFEA